MDDFDGQLLARMPLADAVWTTWRYIADSSILQQIFDQNRGQCYDRLITFPTMVQLVADALLEHSGSGRRSFDSAAASGRLQATPRAAYGKLGRLPRAVSVAFLHQLTDRLFELFPPEAQRKLPDSLEGLSVVTVDGKSIKRIAKRLKELRGIDCGIVGGKAVVATDYATGMPFAMAADLDGDANDVRLLPELISSVTGRIPGQRLWLADRQYCDLVQLERFSNQNDCYVVRYNAKVTFERDTNERSYQGVDDHGNRYTDECGWLGRDGHNKQRYVRRIVLHRDTGGDISIVTELFGVRKYPAKALLDLYRERWGIERVFQKVTEVFGLQRLIGSRPEAGIFQLAFCLLLYSQIQLIRAYVAKHQKMEYEQISVENMFTDVQREVIAISLLMASTDLVASYETMTATDARRRLDRLIRGRWKSIWLKATNKKPRPPIPKQKKKKHKSVYKAIQAYSQ